MVPFNAALSALSTFVPLQILALGGNVVDVGLAIVAYNLAVIPAPIIWGYVSDVTGSRRRLIVASSLLLFGACIGLFLSNSIIGILLFYAVVAHSAGMIAPPVNLLLMEKLPKDEWDRGYSSLNWYTFVGQIIGTAAGVPWVNLLPLHSFTLACSFMAALAAASSFILVHDAKVLMERRALLLTPQGFLSRLGQLPLIFLKVPRTSDFKALVKSARRSLTRDLPVIFAASLLFSASANLFFTSYTPFLKKNSVSDSLVFFVQVYILSVNAVVTRLLIRRVSGRVSHSTASQALLFRAVGMMLAAAFAIFIAGHYVVYTTLVVFGMMGAAFVFINVNLNTLLFRSLPRSGQGGILGAWSALNAVALLAGALASGYVSYYLGYSITFFLSGVLILLSSIVLDSHYGVETGSQFRGEEGLTEEL
jgi:MFS family permease